MMNFRNFALVLGLLSLSVSSALRAETIALEGARPAQFRVVWTSDPAHEAIVSWSTAAVGTSHRLHLRSDSQGEARVVDAESGKYSSGGEEIELYYHHARLRDLQPDTKYYVTLESDGEKSREMHFRTAAADDRDVTVLFGGDSRSSQQNRQKMNRLIAELVSSEPDIIALVHGGDYIASGRKLSQWSEWMSDHELTVTDEGRLLPIVPARGNHDGGPLFNEVFGFAADDLNYYGLQLGPQVRLLTLNTEISIAGDQAHWLAGELEQYRPKVRWLTVQYHRPAFPAVKLPSGALQHWVPLFEQFNVDLVCEADGHCVKRTMPIRDNQPDETGVVYIGEGGLGVGQRTPGKGRWFLNPPGMTASAHHVFVLTFTRECMQGRVILEDGKTLDTFERRARR